jgi:hypothetical protein
MYHHWLLLHAMMIENKVLLYLFICILYLFFHLFYVCVSLSTMSDDQHSSYDRDEIHQQHQRSARELVEQGVECLHMLSIKKEMMMNMNNDRDMMITKQLCERVEIHFASYFSELKHNPEILSHKILMFGGFIRSLEKAVELLRDLITFVDNDLTSLGRSRSWIRSMNPIQTSATITTTTTGIVKSKQIVSFHQRLCECVTSLMPDDVDMDMLNYLSGDNSGQEFQPNTSIMIEELTDMFTHNVAISRANFQQFRQESNENHSQVLESMNSLSDKVTSVYTEQQKVTESFQVMFQDVINSNILKIQKMVEGSLTHFQHEDKITPLNERRLLESQPDHTDVNPLGQEKMAQEMSKSGKSAITYYVAISWLITQLSYLCYIISLFSLFLSRFF